MQAVYVQPPFMVNVTTCVKSRKKTHRKSIPDTSCVIEPTREELGLFTLPIFLLDFLMLSGFHSHSKRLNPVRDCR